MTSRALCLRAIRVTPWNGSMRSQEARDGMGRLAAATSGFQGCEVDLQPAAGLARAARRMAAATGMAA